MSDIVALQHKIIPKWASFDEAVYYVMEYDEHNYNNMMKSIALDELGYVMESAEEQPDNSSKIKKMKDAVVKWLNSAFESLKALFNKALQAIKEKVRSVKGRITGKAIKAAEAKLDKLKDKEYGFTYTYTELDKAVKSSSDSASDVSRRHRPEPDALRASDDSDQSCDYRRGCGKRTSACRHVQGACLRTRNCSCIRNSGIDRGADRIQFRRDRLDLVVQCGCRGNLSSAGTLAVRCFSHRLFPLRRRIQNAVRRKDHRYFSDGCCRGDSRGRLCRAGGGGGPASGVENVQLRRSYRPDSSVCARHRNGTSVADCGGWIFRHAETGRLDEICKVCVRDHHHDRRTLLWIYGNYNLCFPCGKS